MFTGLVERTAVVVSTGVVLRLRAPGMTVERGWSVCVDGSCLSVKESAGEDLLFDLSPETLSRTTAGFYRPGGIVNIELPLRASDMLHGHFVTGHVDCTGLVEAFERRGAGAEATVSFPEGFEGLVVGKGSIAVDGISLTAASVKGRKFVTALIPLTLESTGASSWRPGRRVNLEFDIVGKYVLAGLAGLRPGHAGRPGATGTAERDALLREYLERHG